MNAESQGEAVTRFVVWWFRALLVSVFGFNVAVFVSMAARSDNMEAMPFIAVGVLLSLVLLVRGARAASIAFHAAQIVIRGGFRTRRIPLSRIRHADIGRGTSVALLPWRVPYFVLDDGSSVRADEIRSLRTPSIVDDVVAEARRHLRR